MSMRKNLRGLWVASAVLLLGACTDKIDIQPTGRGSGALSFQLSREVPPLFDRTPRVQEVSVYGKDAYGWDYAHPLWCVESSGGTALDQLRYAAPPAGFSTV